MNASTDNITLAEVNYHSSAASTLGDATRAPSPTDGLPIAKDVLSESDLADQTLYLPAKKVRIIVATLALSFFLAVLEQTILATALPSIASTFKAGKINSWVITAFLLGSTAACPFFGRLADIFGRKQLLLTSTGVFFFSTLACAFASSIEQLIAFRAIQGMGTTGISTMSIIVISDVVPLVDRAKYQGIIETIVVLGQTTGPLLSGVLVEHLSWRACFWTLLPLIAIAAVLQYFFIPSKATSGNWKVKLRSIDYTGSVLMLAATVMLLVAISRGGVEVPWTSPATLVLICLSVVLYVCFGFWELYGASMPIIPLRLFTRPTVIGIHLSTLTSLAANFIIIYYMPEFLQVVRGYTATISGAVVLPYGALTSTFVYVSVVAARRVGTHPLILAGHAGWAVGAGIMTTFGTDTHLGAICGVLSIAAIGAGLCVVTTMMTLEAAVPRADRAVVTSSRTFARYVGASLGVAIASSTILNRLSASLVSLKVPEDIRESILNDPASIQHALKARLDPLVIQEIVQAYAMTFKMLFWIVTGLLISAFVTVVLLVRSHPMERDDDEDQKEAAIVWLEEEKAKKLQKKLDRAETIEAKV